VGNGPCIGNNVTGLDCDVVSVYWAGTAIFEVEECH
jgi:hypothetical protein